MINNIVTYRITSHPQLKKTILSVIFCICVLFFLTHVKRLRLSWEKVMSFVLVRQLDLF